MARSRKKLGEILVGWGVVTTAQVDQAVQMAKGAGKCLGEMLVEAGFAKEEQIAKAIATQFNYEYVDLSANGVGKQVNLKLIPDDLIKKYLILPLAKNGGRLQLIIHDPMDLELLDMLRFRLNVEVEPKLAARSQIKSFIDSSYGIKTAPNGPAGAKDVKMVDPTASLVTESIDRSVDKSVDRSLDKSIDVVSEDAPIVRLTNRIIVEAVKMRASDIHVEPMADRVRLRYRIDGICMERDNLPKRMQNSMLSRLKLMSGMNIAERRVPQDGRIKFPVDETMVDFRVSACPAYHGESVVLRILRPD